MNLLKYSTLALFKCSLVTLVLVISLSNSLTSYFIYFVLLKTCHFIHLLKYKTIKKFQLYNSDIIFLTTKSINDRKKCFHDMILFLTKRISDPLYYITKKKQNKLFTMREKNNYFRILSFSYRLNNFRNSNSNPISYLTFCTFFEF